MPNFTLYSGSEQFYLNPGFMLSIITFDGTSWKSSNSYGQANQSTAVINKNTKVQYIETFKCWSKRKQNDKIKWQRRQIRKRVTF